MTTVVALVAAVADNGVIGDGQRLPWRLSSDMRRFKTLTVGKPVIMGRKTFQSIGRPLPGRRNIVVTRQPDFSAAGIDVVRDIDVALALAGETGGEIMILGGGQIYAETIGRADRLYITHVTAMPGGDVYFPAIDPAVWKAGPEERLPAGDKDSAATRFVIYERRGRPPPG